MSYLSGCARRRERVALLVVQRDALDLDELAVGVSELAGGHRGVHVGGEPIGRVAVSDQI